MKYIYRNVTNVPVTVLLATKNQDSITTCVFSPNASKELDYPGLNLYVPNPLSCIIVDNEMVKVSEPIVVIEPIIEPVIESVKLVQPEPAITLIADEPVSEGPVLTEDEIQDIISSEPSIEEDSVEVAPIVTPVFEVVPPPPAPPIEVVKTAKAPKPVAKTKYGKKN